MKYDIMLDEDWDDVDPFLSSWEKSMEVIKQDIEYEPVITAENISMEIAYMDKEFDKFYDIKYDPKFEQEIKKEQAKKEIELLKE